jgi:glycosyltransferase involved in cell wall biosynthesis
MSSWPRTTYLFKAGRRERLAQGGAFPSEFFYGLIELRRDGKEVGFFDEEELRELSGPEGLFLKLAAKLVTRLFPGLPFSFSAAVSLARPRVLKRLNQESVLIATTQTFGLIMGLLRKLGLLRARVIFIVMGAMPLRMSRRWMRFVGWILGAVEIAAISESEAEYLRARLPTQKSLSYLPFGVDTQFWTPDPSAKQDDYVISIGNDWNRDFTTLVQAWLPEFPRLLIITQLPVDTAGKTNIEVRNGNWRQQLISDVDIRSLYQCCRFAVLPIRQTIQPAGQSACLQLMACGKAVIFSNIQGLWDSRSMQGEETCLLVAPGSVFELQAAVRRLLREPGLAERLGRQANIAISRNFSTNAMSHAIEMLVAKKHHLAPQGR